MIDTIYAAIESFAGLQFLNNEGTGLYLLHSKANHSCSPNAEIVFPFNNNELVINSTSSIEPGEEILIRYLWQSYSTEVDPKSGISFQP